MVPPPPPPVVPATFIDTPTQRLYALSLAAFLQALKINDAIQGSPSNWLILRWFCFDALYVSLLPKLRIPRLTFSWRRKIVLIILSAMLNWILFGHYSLSLPIPSLIPSFGSSGDREISTKEKAVRPQDIVHRDQHLVGEHSVRFSPISTAYLNPSHLSFCLSPPHNTALIPVLLNNTLLTHLEYTIAPVGGKSKAQTIKLNSKDLRKNDGLWKENVIMLSKSQDDEEEDPDIDIYSEQHNYDLYSHKLQPDPSSSQVVKKSFFTSQQQAYYEKQLQKTQSLAHILISKPGVIKLYSAITNSQSEVRIIPSEVVVVECPTAYFEETKVLAPKECAGGSKDLAIKARGVAPLKLKWHKETNGKKEHFVVEGIEGAPETVNLPVTEDVTIPLSVPLATVGKHHYVIDSLTDAVGNVFEASSLPHARSSRSVEVIHRSAVTFPNCGSGRTVSLHQGKEAKLILSIAGAKGSVNGKAVDGVRSVKVQYEPSQGDSKGRGWTKDITPQIEDGRITPLSATHAGVYTILGVQGEHCPGDVLSPEACRVVELPMPSADVELKSIHECSGDVGIKASLVLHGTPPFTIHYTTQRNKEEAKTLSRAIPSSRGEVVLQPESPGTYAYRFTHVSDQNYKNVKLEGNGLAIKQVVHPLAAAEFVRSDSRRSGSAGGKQSLSSCSGSGVNVQVDLRGTPPWTLEFQLVGPSGSRIVRVPDVREPRSDVSLAIPDEVDVQGGTFQIDLVSVVDATECQRSLNVPGISVDVKRIKPTARFYSNYENRQVTILEGETASLPLRLTGDGPWSLGYRLGDEGPIQHTIIRNPNGVLQVQERGTYQLVEIQDDYCPGSVVQPESTYHVDWIPKPSVQFARSAGASARNNSIIREPVCAGTEDYAELLLTGRAPYQISYQYSAELGSHDRARDVVTFNSVQATARLQLRTTTAGHHRYQLTQIGDGAYPVSRHSQSLSMAKGLLLEQDVLIRPTAEFKTLSRLSYCLNDPLSPRNHHSEDGTILLKGQPPFTLALSLRSIATNDVVHETVKLDAHEWRVNVPGYKFSSVGSTLITIDSVQDSSPCSQAELDSLKSSLWVDVAETAAIVPFDRREDYCEGDILSFQLEGTPPWTVRYLFNGKITSAISKTPKFSRVPVEPGLFKIVSVAHQSNMCQTNVEGIQVKVRPIPIAKVSHGKLRAEDLREGEQAKITFDLVGTPPFAFTYQRTELAQRGTRGAKVLETHTVSNVMSKEYSIFSAQEGTWTVTFISDKYCRYPSTAPDSSIEEA